MQRFTRDVLAVGLALALTSCGAPTPRPEPTPVEAPAEPTATEPPADPPPTPADPPTTRRVSPTSSPPPINPDHAAACDPRHLATVGPQESTVQQQTSRMTSTWEQLWGYRDALYRGTVSYRMMETSSGQIRLVCLGQLQLLERRRGPTTAPAEICSAESLIVTTYGGVREGQQVFALTMGDAPNQRIAEVAPTDCRGTPCPMRESLMNATMCLQLGGLIDTLREGELTTGEMCCGTDADCTMFTLGCQQVFRSMRTGAAEQASRALEPYFQHCVSPGGGACGGPAWRAACVNRACEIVASTPVTR